MANKRINQLTTTTIDTSYVFPFQVSSGDVDPVNNTLLALREAYIPYDVITFNLTKSGSVTGTLLQNDTGATFTYTNPNNGVINVAASSAIFTSAKTFVISGSYNLAGTPYFITGVWVDTSNIQIIIQKYDGTQAATPSFTNLIVSARIYY